VAIEPTQESVSFWLGQLKDGHDDAARQLWRRYFESLVGVARRHISKGMRRTLDEEDVALSAFDSFVRGVDEKKFPQLDDRNDLWRLLLMITLRKAATQTTREKRQKRGSGNVRSETEMDGRDDPGFRLAHVLARNPGPEVALMLREQLDQLFARLESPELKSIALHKMEGYTDAEIANMHDCARRTVVRKLGVIRSLWTKREF
jgi:DNA-directed RNA polymerase specialized sigma24 family protein